MRAITLALGLLVIVIEATANGQVSGASVQLPHQSIASAFVSNQVEPLRQFRALRHLEATNKRFNKHGWMDVRAELSPEGHFSFEVLAEGGSSYIRKKVLLPILEGERDIVVRGDATRAALNASNYHFAAEEPGGPGLVRLTVRPLREEMTLIDGALIVTDTDADLVRVEGRLSRNPSFWTRSVDIVRRYGRVAGVRVPLGVESVAQIRIAGRSEMSMTYQYEMVNGQVVDTLAGSDTQ
jgi:hypothetical protein